MTRTKHEPESWRAPIERLRGMSDVGESAYLARDAVLNEIQAVFDQHGYRAVDTPVIESTELFLRKSGGERVAQMYALNYRDREISLRPEFTSSIIRHFIEAMQSDPLPVRLRYSGPVFRYERPQAGRSRQFTEVGCELLGAAGSAADAETIHLAIEGLSRVGVGSKLVIGHIGIVLAFLDRLPLRQRARDWLIWSLERLRKGNPVDIEDEIGGLVSGGRLPSIFSEMSDKLRDVPTDELEHWVLAVLHEVGIQMQGGTRTPEEIVAGVIGKMQQTSDADDVRKAFSFISELVGIQGQPATVLPELRALVSRHGLPDEPIAEIETTLDLLDAYGCQVDEVELNLGMGRGLHYYTGVLFEIYDPKRPWLQLCGGGRYDELAQSLGARTAVPACGFSYGLERVVEASDIAPDSVTPELLVVPADEASLAHAARVGEGLRSTGAIVEVDVRGRSLSASKRYAQRRGISHIILVEPDGTQTRHDARRNPGGPHSAPDDGGREE